MVSLSADNRNILHAEQAPQQLANLTNVLPQVSPSPPHSVAIVWVNILWLLSLVFSLASALTALLIQQWARMYMELPQIPSSSSERARVRSFLFFGTLKYNMCLAVDMVPALLHLSVFLFLAGLVIFLYTIHKTVAIVLSISVGLLGLAYITLTILPCVYRDCPYRTPMSGIAWQIWHILTFLVAFCLQWTLKRLHTLLVPYNLGEVKSLRQRKLTAWLDGVENLLDKQKRCLKDGLRQSTARAALETSEIVDLKALAWLLKLPALAEKSRIQDFITNIPGVTIVQLMSVPAESGRIIFRDHLLALLRSCAPGTVGIDDDVRKSRLLVCLDAVHRLVKASSAVHGVSPSESVLSDVRTNFANIGLMRALWADTDPSIRLVSRSICALLARYFLRKYPLERSELAWLQDVMGKPSSAIYNSLDDLAKADTMNLDSYVYGVLSHDTDDLPIEEATIFMDTLAILASAGSQVTFRRSVLEVGIFSLMKRAEEEDGHLLDVVEKLRRIYQAVFHGYQTTLTSNKWTTTELRN
jgi:Family of unknown function (DUF6535)